MPPWRELPSDTMTSRRCRVVPREATLALEVASGTDGTTPPVGSLDRPPGPDTFSVMATPGSERVPHTWDEVRTLNPGTANVGYLDSAAAGVISTRVGDAMTAVLAEHQQLGIAAAPYWRDHASDGRASLRLVGGRADQVTFTQNTGTGLATVTNGMDWRHGDNVVVPRRGVQVREVAMTDGQARVDDVLAALGARTRVLPISAV